ncbi:MAG TPA: pilus assembly protein PilM [Solirubrobacteraceae bacterium]|jgi:type IV pilus assembly protein PilM
MLQLPSLSLDLNLGRRRAATDVVGLDVQPGLVAAVKVRVNGSIRAERAVVKPLDADVIREGEVVDVEALGEALRELFAEGGLDKRVRLGIANQRSVMRTIELPPVTDRKELAAAVAFQAQDEVPMPLANAVLDFHPLGVSDTPDGPRQRVVLVAAQRDMVERLLSAVRAAGLTPVGVDLSAFALIRSLCRLGEGDAERVLYLNVDGLTNLAIAQGEICRFTRVIGGGVEAMANELATRRGIPLREARALLSVVDLSAPAPDPALQQPQAPALEQDASPDPPSVRVGAAEHDEREFSDEPVEQPASSPEEHEAHEASMGFLEAMAHAEAPVAEPAPAPAASTDDIRVVLENGVRELAGEIRNSLDFHRAQDQGGEISYVSMSGAALDLPGFARALQDSLAMEVRSEAVGLVDEALAGEVSTHRLSVAAGLATLEAPR